jgi:hypothetical protein
MYTAAGKAKPVAGVVRQAFTGSLVPHVLNPGFVPLPDGSGIPALWHPWFVSGTMGVAAGRGLSGGNALAFAHTVHQSGGASSFYAIPMQPVIYGQTWTASVMARGRNATGTTLIQLAWYDRNGHWLGSANSRNLTLGTTSWAPLRVTSQVPDHAAAVRIFLQSSTNSGSAYFAKPSWSVS